MKGICVVGYGYWGPKLVRNFLAAAAGRKVAVCDDNRAWLERAKHDFPGVATFATFDEMLTDSSCDADLRSDEERNRLLFDYRGGDVYSPKMPGREALTSLAADFVPAAGGGSWPVSDSRFGADVGAILHAAQQSVRLRGQEVALG